MFFTGRARRSFILDQQGIRTCLFSFALNVVNLNSKNYHFLTIQYEWLLYHTIHFIVVKFIFTILNTVFAEYNICICSDLFKSTMFLAVQFYFCE